MNSNLNHQAAVAAAKAAGRCAYHVRHVCGWTIEWATSESVARSCLAGGNRTTHNLEIYRVSPLGHQTRIHKPPMLGGGFIMADLAKVAYAKRRS